MRISDWSSDVCSSDLTIRVAGTLFDIGRFPGIKTDVRFCNRFVTCERISVTDEELETLDAYEGYFPFDLDQSLYVRERFRDGWLYVFNRLVEDYPIIPSGDRMLQDRKSTRLNSSH